MINENIDIDNGIPMDIDIFDEYCNDNDSYFPMDYEYTDNFSIEQINYTKKLIKNTVFPMKEFVNENEREKFALRLHKEYNAKNFDDLCEKIAKYHLKKKYCNWCNDYVKDNIIEHEHIKGNAGRYRGCLCVRCNRLEGIMKKYEKDKKIQYLYEKIGEYVEYDLKWIIKCVMSWYYE